MTTLSHPYFGTLTPSDDDDVIWEGEVFLKDSDKPTQSWLWLYSDNKDELFNQDNLDKCQNALKALDDFHQKAKPYLLDYLKNDPDFMGHYVENIDELNLPELKNLINNHTLSPETFVKLLHLDKFDIWLSDDFRIIDDEQNHQIVMDYRIDPTQCDQILAVKFDLDGKFIDVAWES